MTTFFQLSNVKLYTFQWLYILTTQLLLRHLTKSWDVQLMVVWVVTDMQSHTSDKFVPKPSTLKTEAAGFSWNTTNQQAYTMP